jgi:hypothetical protein
MMSDHSDSTRIRHNISKHRENVPSQGLTPPLSAGRTKRLIIYIAAYTGILLGLLSLTSCHTSQELDAETAKEVLKQYVGRCYGLSTPKTAVATVPQNIEYTLVQLARDAGLVETSQEGVSGKSSDRVNVQLSERGNALTHFEDMRQNISFQVSENTIDEIISVTREGTTTDTGAPLYLVLFSYTQRYNDLGKTLLEMKAEFNQSWIEDNTQLRGKATMYYDKFLKHYVVETMMWSVWNREDWQPARFLTNSKKDIGLYYSYGNYQTVVPLPTVPVPENKTQERLWEAERINQERITRQEEQRKQIEQTREQYQKEVDNRSREMERTRVHNDLRQLEQEAEMKRRNDLMALEREQQQRELERRNAEQERLRRFRR